jgi:hypothetical protein
MATVIKTKNGSGAPLASDLVQGELAIDLTNKRLYTENASGAVIELGTVPSTIDINAGTIDGTVIGGSSAAAGSFTTLTASGEITANGGIALGDNDKAKFGAGDDLQIYHNGSHSLISETGTGNLYIQGSSTVFLGSPTQNQVVINDGTDVKLRYNGSDKLATTATGIDVTGTVTADGLTVDGNIQVNGTNAGQLTLDATGQYTQVIFEQNGSSNSGGDILYDHTNDIYAFRGLAVGDMQFKTSAVAGTALKRQNIASNGDISFYEDTGSTAKFFWDASAESLGIGTTSPYTALDVSGGTTNQVAVFRSTDTTATIGFADDTTPLTGNLSYVTVGAVGNNMVFNTNLAERMRIDSSGNLLVGKTSSGIATSGVELTPSDRSSFTRESGFPILVNRTGSDGEIINIRKDGTTVGSIGANSSNAYISGTTRGLHFTGTAGIIPCNEAGAARDADTDIGSSSTRFKDLYLSGGVYLGGTGAANKLDDYEEGTWTPTCGGNGLSSTGYARYTKIGNLVQVDCEVTLASQTSTNQMSIGGLPFSVWGDAAGVIAYTTSSTVSNTILTQATGMYFYTTATTVSTLADYSAAFIRMQVTYRTTA